MRTRFLDGLRGVAALTVVFDHYWFAYFPVAIGATNDPSHHAYEWVIRQTPLYILFNGNFAVCLFFILSGFVLSQRFFRTGEGFDLVPTIAKRYARLWLPAAGAILLAYWMMKLGLTFNQRAAFQSGSDWLQGLWGFTPTFHQAVVEAGQTFFLDSHNFDGPLWTMHIELWGSLMVFGLVTLFTKYTNRLAVYVLLGGLLWQTYYVCFVIGIALCDVVHSEYYDKIKARIGSSGWVLLLVGLYFGAMPSGPLEHTLYAPLSIMTSTTIAQLVIEAHILGAAFVLGGVLTTVGVQNWLNSRPAQFLGTISFSLYLLHFIILASFSSYLFYYLIVGGHGYRASFIIMLIPSLILIFTSAYLYAKYVDAGAIAASKRVYSGVAAINRRWQIRRRGRKLAIESTSNQPVAPPIVAVKAAE
ncbi:acyltransferase [Candidatus Saccharibacteria bacterium]|nr:acyltransferase [Candidatus Saccharibacteria bacterium]